MNDVVNHTLLVSIPLLIFPTLMLLYALGASHEAFRNDFPEDIQQHMPPATPEDQRRGWLFGGIYLLTLLGTLVYSTLLFLQHHGGNFRLGFAVALTMEVMMLLIDLFIIDWLIICTLRPGGLSRRVRRTAPGGGITAFMSRPLFSVNQSWLI